MRELAHLEVGDGGVRGERGHELAVEEGPFGEDQRGTAGCSAVHAGARGLRAEQQQGVDRDGREAHQQRHPLGGAVAGQHGREACTEVQEQDVPSRIMAVARWAVTVSAELFMSTVSLPR